MTKVRKFNSSNIRQISGGKDPIRVIEDFILRHGFSPDECMKQKEADAVRWMLKLPGGEELEILAEGTKKLNETTIYMGINVATVPIRGSFDMLTAALEIADGLVGIKLSLVGHFLVLSSTLGAQGVSVEELDYNLNLISAQHKWFREALADELGWELVYED
jgi:hypothetical protein